MIGEARDGGGLVGYATWSEGSRRKHRQGYGPWLSFVMRHLPESLRQPPAARISEPRVRADLAECGARFPPTSIAGLLLDPPGVAKALDPQVDWAWLEMVVNRLQGQADRRSLSPLIP